MIRRSSRGCRPTPAPGRCEGSTPQWSSCAGYASRFASFQAERRSVRAHHTKTFPHDTRKRETGGVYKRMLRNFGDTAAITPMCNGAHNQNKGIPAGPPDKLQYGETTLLLAAVTLFQPRRWSLEERRAWSPHKRNFPCDRQRERPLHGCL